MPQIIIQPAPLCFSSLIEDIVISTSQKSGLLNIELTGDETVYKVLEETMTPYKQLIRISDLSGLLEPYVREFGEVELRCVFTDSDGTVSISPVTVLFGHVDVGMPAADFVANHFLTVLDGEKMTAYDRMERLGVYGSEQVTVEAEVRLPVGTYAEKSAVLAEESQGGLSVRHIDVSPKRVAEAIELVGGRLLAYTVKSGKRIQEFRIVEDLTPPDPSLAFVNSFGVIEYLHCCGTLKRDSKFTRDQVRIRQHQKVYNVVEEKQFTANTGWLNDAMSDWAEELFRSREVYLLEDGRLGHEVVLTDSKGDWNNEEDEMVAYEFSYTYAARMQNVMRRTKRARIFSEQFEMIYN
ncbi:MAG: hypothetical protein ACTTKJ_06625 [Prevotella koreensis]|uniref:hypothetical protein n=1 Tax=Prevotella koreensis TaxID=2490854 RepID=UPI003FA04732